MPEQEDRKELVRQILYGAFPTPQQACAIYKWLELALEWEGLCVRKDEIESALLYWGERRKPSDRRHES